MRKLVDGLALIKDTNEWIKANNATAKQTHERMADGRLKTGSSYVRETFLRPSRPARSPVAVRLT